MIFESKYELEDKVVINEPPDMGKTGVIKVVHFGNHSGTTYTVYLFEPDTDGFFTSRFPIYPETALTPTYTTEQNSRLRQGLERLVNLWNTK